MKYTNFIKCLLASIPLLSFWGCESEDLPNSGQGELVPVTIRLTTTAPNDVQTRANEHTAELVNNDYTISSLNVYITDGSSTTTLNYDDFTFTEPENEETVRTATVELVRGRTYTVYAIANADIDNYSTNSPVNAISMVNSTTVPMSAQTTWTIDGGTETIELVRMVAQMQVTLIDQRTATDKPDINSVKIEGFPSTTYLYRQSSVSIPEGAELDGSWEQTNDNSSWSWDETVDNYPAHSFLGFYLHEANGGRITVKEDGEDDRTGSFSESIPRNRILPLKIYITDYALSIDASYEYAPIGVYPIEVEITDQSEYELKIPEGASNIKIEISLKVSGKEETVGVSWDDDDSIPYFKSSTDGGVLTLTCDAFPALPSETYTVTATYNGREIPFELSLRELGNTEWTRSASSEAQPIIIEL